jgi:hypothetical protein
MNAKATLSNGRQLKIMEAERYVKISWGAGSLYLMEYRRTIYLAVVRAMTMTPITVD